MEKNEIESAVLRAFEVSLEAQLRAVKRLRSGPPPQAKAARKRTSQIGLVQDVQFGAGEAPLLIVNSGASQYEIPYAEAYLKNTDLGHKKIVMMLPEGMLELNAPLTAEEKEQQKNSRKLSS